MHLRASVSRCWPICREYRLPLGQVRRQVERISPGFNAPHLHGMHRAMPSPRLGHRAHPITESTTCPVAESTAVPRRRLRYELCALWYAAGRARGLSIPKVCWHRGLSVMSRKSLQLMGRARLSFQGIWNRLISRGRLLRATCSTATKSAPRWIISVLATSRWNVTRFVGIGQNGKFSI